MQITLSVIKADIGSIGGHICPSAQLFETVRRHVAEAGRELLIDSYVSFTGDDIAIMMSHTHGLNDERVHKLAWDAFVAGTETAKRQGLYGAGQDLLKDAFSGNVHGLGPAVAEMTFEERPNEPFLFFAADKTDPGAYNLPLYLAFADPMTTPGLILAPSMAQGFRFVIMDVNYTEGDRAPGRRDGDAHPGRKRALHPHPVQHLSRPVHVGWPVAPGSAAAERVPDPDVLRASGIGRVAAARHVSRATARRRITSKRHRPRA